MRPLQPPTDDQGLTSKSTITEVTIMTELTREPPTSAVRHAPSARHPKRRRRAGRCSQRQPACRRAADPAEAVAVDRTRRVGRHRRRQWSGKDHVAGDPRGTATTVCRGGSARRRRSRCPSRAPIPGSATCRRTTSSTSRCPCAARCATRRGYGCPRAHRRPRRTGWSRRPCTTSTWLIGPTCRSVRCPAASASGPASPWSY